MTNVAPHITAQDIHTQRGGGYHVRAACMIDGFPGEVEITLDEDHRRYSTADVSFYSHADRGWRTIYTLPKQHLQDLPILPDSPEGLRYLNNLANTLYGLGSSILIAARVREHELDGESAAAEEAAKLRVRDAYYAAQRDDMKAARAAKRPKRPDADVTAVVNGETIPVDVIYNETEETEK